MLALNGRLREITAFELNQMVLLHEERHIGNIMTTYIKIFNNRKGSKGSKFTIITFGIVMINHTSKALRFNDIFFLISG